MQWVPNGGRVAPRGGPPGVVSQWNGAAWTSGWGGMTAEATGSGGTESGTCALAKVRAPLGTCPWCPLARVDATLVAGPGLLAPARVAAGLSRAPGILEFLICRLPM